MQPLASARQAWWETRSNFDGEPNVVCVTHTNLPRFALEVSVWIWHQFCRQRLRTRTTRRKSSSSEMRFTKPSWVRHGDAGKDADPGKRVSIFSVHVHPDGSRIATGGLDGKVRIWSTKPILSETAELNGRPPKSLCTLNMHTGPVLTVRWAHSGRWLASGSDDTIVMIWDLDP